MRPRKELGLSRPSEDVWDYPGLAHHRQIVLRYCSFFLTVQINDDGMMPGSVLPINHS